MKLSKRILIVATLIAVAPLVPAQAGDSFSITTDHIYGHKAGMALTFDSSERGVAEPHTRQKSWRKPLSSE